MPGCYPLRVAYHAGLSVAEGAARAAFSRMSCSMRLSFSRMRVKRASIEGDSSPPPIVNIFLQIMSPSPVISQWASSQSNVWTIFMMKSNPGLLRRIATTPLTVWSPIPILRANEAMFRFSCFMISFIRSQMSINTLRNSIIYLVDSNKCLIFVPKIALCFYKCSNFCRYFKAI